MAYVKKGTTGVVDNSKKKLSAMIKIDADKKKTIDYGEEGNSLTAEVMAAKLQEYEAAKKEYDSALDSFTEKQNLLDAIEVTLGEFNKRILKSAAGKFNQESDEYEMLGGKKPSDWKKRASKKVTPAS